MAGTEGIEEFRHLIERSSLGTEGARRLRARTPQSRAQSVTELAHHRENLAASREAGDKAAMAAAALDKLTALYEVLGRAGDAAACREELLALRRDNFIELFEREYRPVVVFLMRCGAGIHDAEDAAQGAFAELWHRLPGRFESVSNPRAWVRTAAYKRYLRGRRRLVAEGRVIPESALARDDASPSTEALFVLDALRKLDPQQQAVMAFTIDGYTASEIASELGTTEQKVRDLRKKARMTLARQLGQLASEKKPAGEKKESWIDEIIANETSKIDRELYELLAVTPPSTRGGTLTEDEEERHLPLSSLEQEILRRLAAGEPDENIVRVLEYERPLARPEEATVLTRLNS
jgi:RNA polymerase sigma factor (sigma-70 family)